MFAMLLFSALAAGYVILRAVVPSQLPLVIRIFLYLLILVSAFKFHVIRFFGGPNYFAPKIPGSIVVLLSTLHFAIIITAFFFLLSEFVLVPLWIMGKNAHANTVHAVLAGIALAISFIGLYNATKAPKITNYTVSVKDLPKEAEGLRLAVVADLHADDWTKTPRIEKIIERVNAEKPDVVLLTGDFADGSVEEVGPYLEPLKKLFSRYGNFAVSGNHEFYNGWEKWQKFLESLGLIVLENTAVDLPLGVSICGISDQAFANSSVAKASFAAKFPIKVLVAHRPSAHVEARQEKFSLQVSGHTHGGMTPLLNKIVAKFNGGAVSGIYNFPEDDFTLIVSNGANLWSGFPIRLGAPAEIPIITLTAK